MISNDVRGLGKIGSQVVELFFRSIGFELSVCHITVGFVCEVNRRWATEAMVADVLGAEATAGLSGNIHPVTFAKGEMSLAEGGQCEVIADGLGGCAGQRR